MRRDVELALKKQRLQFRSAELRTQLGDNLDVILTPVGVLSDGAVAGYDWLRRHPVWLAGAGIALLLARPQRLWRWGWRAWGAWRVVQQLQPQLLQWLFRSR